jgi:hypothetical protein
MMLDCLFVISNLAEQLTVDRLFVEIFMHKVLGIVDSSCCLDFFESELNYLELFHLLLNFISEHLVDKDMCQENFTPILLIEVFVLDGPFCNLI